MPRKRRAIKKRKLELDPWAATELTLRKRYETYKNVKIHDPYTNYKTKVGDPYYDPVPPGSLTSNYIRNLPGVLPDPNWKPVIPPRPTPKRKMKVTPIQPLQVPPKFGSKVRSTITNLFTPNKKSMTDDDSIAITRLASTSVKSPSKQKSVSAPGFFQSVRRSVSFFKKIKTIPMRILLILHDNYSMTKTKSMKIN